MLGNSFLLRRISFFFDTVKDPSEFCEPVGVDGGDGGHIFFRGEDKFVVDYVKVSIITHGVRYCSFFWGVNMPT